MEKERRRPSANNYVPLQRIWRWYFDFATPYTASMHTIKEVIYSGRTKYQEVDIVVTYDFGKALFLDGKIQSTVADEYYYHEPLVHVPMLTHPKPERVLIIGGGEGATAREVLKHNTVKEVVMVDIDEEVVSLCRKYLPEMHQGAFEDPRFKLIIDDGRKFVEKANDKSFDVVIVDATDPLPEGPSRFLYTLEFYREVHRVLDDDGVMVTQATSVFYTKSVFAAILNTIGKIFKIARAYQHWVPSFYSPWGFVLGSKRHDPLELSKEDIAKRIEERGLKGRLKLYYPDLHHALFVMPLEVKEAFISETKVSTDTAPICIPV